ncbi:glycosyltransferase family 4 protein [Paenibacillus sp. NPDC058071]|uniref:glycosyltransferase family 4 protein n=1 Tax=Paenibacillus sp. NPDC058071 TaxID=3346326 RepID=UPI0036DDC0C7
MKILIATYWLLPHVGGVWAYIQDLKASLERQGHQVDIFARHPDKMSYYMIQSGSRVDKKRFISVIEPYIRDAYAPYAGKIDSWIIEQEIELCAFALAASFFGLQKYDLIHAQDVISARALWQIKPAGIPQINTIHGCLANEYWLTRGGQVPQNSIWKYACAREYYGVTSSDVSIVPTQWLHRILAGYKVPHAHMEVIPYGMDIVRFLSRMEEGAALSFPKSTSVIICPARMDYVKGHSCLLEALYRLKQSRSDWVCLLVGDGDLRQELQQKASQFGLDQHVIFMGNRSDVPALLKHSDIVVLPSLHDNQPFTVMEAQVAKKAVVATDAGGIPEMITQGVTGLLAHAGSAGHLMVCLKALLDDPALRNQLAANGRQWGLMQWSLPTMLQRTLSLYDDVLKGKRVRTAAHPPKSVNKYTPLVRTAFYSRYNMQIPTSFSLVDDHIVGSILFGASG